MSTLNLEPNIAAPDDFYQALMEAHEGLSEAQSQLLNAKLVLVLANQVGTMDTLLEAISVAKEGLEPQE